MGGTREAETKQVKEKSKYWVISHLCGTKETSQTKTHIWILSTEPRPPKPRSTGEGAFVLEAVSIAGAMHVGKV